MSDTYYSIKKDSDNKSIDIPALFFSNAVKKVISTMAGLEVIETKISDETFIAQISGVVMLVGDANVLLSITVSKQMAYLLVSCMTGMMVQQLNEEEIYDGIAEIINMISGETRAQLSGRKLHFNALPPFAISGDKHFIIHKNKVSNLVKKFRAGDNDIYLRVYFL